MGERFSVDILPTCIVFLLCYDGSGCIKTGERLRLMKDQKLKEEFLVLRAQGQSFEKIAKQLKVSKQTLINWSRDKRRHETVK